MSQMNFSGIMGKRRCVTCFLLLVVWSQVSSAENSLEVHYNVSENHSPGVYIGNIAQDTSVLQNVSSTERESIRFQIYEETRLTLFFVIDYVTGDLNTSGKNIDREEICMFNDVCEITFEVYVRASSFFSIPVVKITILDKNDNAPSFRNTVDTLTIPEQETVGTYFRLGEVYDADTLGDNSIQTFNLEQPELFFELEFSKNADKYIFGVKLAKSLDRETLDRIAIKVIVMDGGNPVQTGTHDVIIDVTDDNDHSPVFEKSEYNVTIDENITPNSVFLTLSAKDNDIGQNGAITYSIRNRQLHIDTITRLFKVNENTGDVSVISELTHEPSEYYEFIVDAVDQGDIQRTNSTLVKVTVNDVENNAPSIEINLLTDGNTVSIEENQPKDFFVAHVIVVDNDKGENGQFSCNITDDLFVLEKFQGRGLKVIVSGVLDRENKPMHNITVLCHDHGVPPKYSHGNFGVRVTDVNDNDPEFEHSVYSASIKENNTFGEVVTRVTAKDADSGQNGSVEYFLQSNDGRFNINNSTGVITAIQKLDREKEELIIFEILAVDHGQPRRTGTATVSLTLIDVNDNAPVIIPARPEIWVAENLKANITIGVLEAKDLDTGSFGQFTFAMAPLDTECPFEINANGAIRATKSLNREEHNRYDLPVTVTDMGTNRLSNTQHVTIYVTDVNDNAPKVTFPNEDNDTVTFLYQPDIYNVVTTIAAYDIDDGENGTMRFTILSGNDEGIFEIDQDLGELSVVKYIDIKHDLAMTLEIEVKDNALNPRSTRCKLKIELLYSNATGAKALEDGVGNKYVIISVVVIVTTIAVAVAIIGVILFLRKLDNKKTHEDVCARYSDSGISSGSDSQQPEGDYPDGRAGKKRKEVSFSLEYSLAGLDGGRNTESTTDDYDQNRYYDPPATTVQLGPPTYTIQKQESIDSHMKALKLQQYLLEAKNRTWENPQVQHLPLGDSESETSRDTVTCDSGRGGSEDDVSTSSPIIDEKNFFGLQESRPQKKVSFLAPQHYHTHHVAPPPVRESTPIHQSHAPPRPPSYRLSNSDLHNQGKPVHPQRLAIKDFSNSAHMPNNSNQTHYNNQNNHQRQPFNHSEPWRDLYYNKNGGLPPRMRHDSGSSFRSNDDDGGSTTTSGSYTLDQTDMDITDIYGNRRDLVV